MFFSQLYIPGLAHCSYVLGGKTQCLVVDPPRDIQGCLEAAGSFGLPVTAVIETHLHADFVSGHRELAQLEGVTVMAPRDAGCAFPHLALEDGEELLFDNLRLRLLATPGHTPESSIFLVTDRERGEDPVLAFTGDALLVGDVGRPDLFPGRQEELAERLYQSLRRLEGLEDRVEVYPAHGMGSLCGRSLSAKLWSTLGTERRFNYAFLIHPVEKFREEILAGMPEVPDHFARCSEINRRGPGLLGDLVPPRALEPQEFAALAKGGQVVDTRDHLSFAAAHVPGAFSLGLQGNFSTYAGWVLEPDKPVLLVLGKEEDLAQTLVGLRRVGLDKVTGFLRGGMGSWINGGEEVSSIEVISIYELRRRLNQGKLTVLDNRLKSEWDQGHIPGLFHVPAPQVRQRAREWDPGEPLAVLCNTSNRSILAASLLKQRGFKKVALVTGGTTAWEAAGFPLIVD